MAVLASALHLVSSVDLVAHQEDGMVSHKISDIGLQPRRQGIDIEAASAADATMLSSQKIYPFVHDDALAPTSSHIRAR